MLAVEMTVMAEIESEAVKGKAELLTESGGVLAINLTGATGSSQPVLLE